METGSASITPPFFLQTLTIDTNSGALSAQGTISTFSPGQGIAVDPTATFLAIGDTTTGTLAGGPAVGIYKIASDGSLTLAPGSPMSVFGIDVAGLAWDASGNAFSTLRPLTKVQPPQRFLSSV